MSRGSYVAIFIFLSLHEIGAHYTYSEVPYDVWFEALVGNTLSDTIGWERNHFDRLIHFLYGILIAYPMRELFLRVTLSRGFWSYFLAGLLTIATSALFELVEWAAAVIFGGELGMAYLGTQGDVWDAHKDMLCAGVGAAIGLTVIALVNVGRAKDNAALWVERLQGSLEAGGQRHQC
jgi:putative membrane protein